MGTNCHCGATLDVQFHEAGSTTVCPQCQSSVEIPSVSQLQSQAGRTPFVRPIDLLQQQLADQVAPFDGICHKCQSKNAAFECPISILAFRGRFQTKGGRLRLSRLGTLTFKGPTYQSEYQHLEAPLQLCATCFPQFELEFRQSRETAKAVNWTVFLCVLVLDVCGLFFFQTNRWLILPITLVGFLLSRWVTDNQDAFARHWIAIIPGMTELFGSEMEAGFRLRDPVKIPDAPH